MARGDSQRAIGAVTKLIRDHLTRRGFIVTVGKPEDAADNNTAAKLNLFLYEAVFDASMRNIALEEGRPPPIWLTLRYLITAFDDGELSDSPEAHELLGRGVMALNELNFLRLDAAVANDVRLALEMNPEPLKITFDEGAPELLSKLMQGAEETYRLSVAFQARPVLLMPAEPDPSSLLVGVDYTQVPAVEIGLDGVAIEALPSLGPRLDRVDPAVFEPGETIHLYGADLHLSGLEAVLGEVVLRVIGQRSDRLEVEVEGTPPGGVAEGPIAAGGAISAGEHPIRVRQDRGGGRYRGSNLLAGALRPVVTGAALAGADLQLNGLLLGTGDDDIVVSFLSGGSVVQSFETAVPSADQKSLTVPGVGALGTGQYFAVLRINGVQARISPLVVVP